MRPFPSYRQVTINFCLYRSSKQDVGKGRSGFPLKQRSDNVNVPELLTFDTQDPGTDGAKMTTEDEEVQLLRNHMTVLEVTFLPIF